MMTRFPTRWLTVPLTAVTVTVVLAAEPDEGPADGPSVIAEVEPDEHGRELTARQRTVAGRIAYKEALITELIEGRATLADIAAEFLRLNRESPSALAAVRTQFPGETDEEKHAHNVIGFVQIRNLPKARTAELLARLDREFEAAYGHPAIVQ
jgi:hypothetical protein